MVRPMCQIKLALMQAIVLVYILPAVKTQCEKHEAAGFIGDQVQFRICDEYNIPLDQKIDVYPKYSPMFSVYMGSWTNNWYWEPLSPYETVIVVYITPEDTYFEPVYIYAYGWNFKTLTFLQPGRPVMCNSGDSRVQTLTANLGDDVHSTLCIRNLDDSLLADLNVEQQSSILAAESSLSSSFNVRVQSGTGSYHEQELVFEVTNMSEADVGNWTVRVDNTYDTLTIDVVIEAIAPPALCDDEHQNRTISSHIGELLQFSICILCRDGKQPYVQNISKFSESTQQYEASDNSLTVNISRRGDDLIEHEVGVSIDSMSEEDAGLWVISVATQSGWVDVFFALEMLEQRPSPSASNNALAIGLGLTSVVIVIAIAVGVVWAIRRFRGKDKTKTALSNSGDTTENPETTRTKHINLAFTSESETDLPGTREGSSVEIAETSRMSKEKTLGRLDHISGSLVQQESGDIDGRKDGALHSSRSSHSSLSDLESEDGIDRSFYDIGPDGGIQILKSNPETSSSLYDIPPVRKPSDKTFDPYELPKATAILWRSSDWPKNMKTAISSHKVATDALHLTNTNHKHTDSQKCFNPDSKNCSQSYENVPNALIYSRNRRSADRQNYINVMKLPNISSKSNESSAVNTATYKKDSKVALKPPKLQPKRKTTCAHPSARQTEAEKASIPASNRPESYENIPDEQINAKSSLASANTQNRTGAGNTKDSSTTTRNKFANVAKNAQNPQAKLQNSQKSSKPGPNRPQANENVSDGQMNTNLGSAVDTEYSNSLLNIHKSPSQTNKCPATISEFPLGGTKRPKILPKKHLQPKSQMTVLYPNAKQPHAQTPTTPGPLRSESYENIVLISVGTDKQNLKRNPVVPETSSGDKVPATTADPETYENVLVQKNGTVIIPQQ